MKNRAQSINVNTLPRIQPLSNERHRRQGQVTQNIPSGASKQVSRKMENAFKDAVQTYSDRTERSRLARQKLAQEYVQCLNDIIKATPEKQKELQKTALTKLADIENLYKNEKALLDKLQKTAIATVKAGGGDWSAKIDHTGKSIPPNELALRPAITAKEFLSMVSGRRIAAAEGECLVKAMPVRAKAIRAGTAGDQIKKNIQSMEQKYAGNPARKQQDLEKACKDLASAEKVLQDEKAKVEQARKELAKVDKTTEEVQREARNKLIVGMGEKLIKTKEEIVDEKNEEVRKFTCTMNDAVPSFRESIACYDAFLQETRNFKDRDRLGTWVEILEKPVSLLIANALRNVLIQAEDLQPSLADDFQSKDFTGRAAYDNWFKQDAKNRAVEGALNGLLEKVTTALDDWYENSVAYRDFHTKNAGFADELIEVGTSMTNSQERDRHIKSGRHASPGFRSRAADAHRIAIYAMNDKLHVMASRLQAVYKGPLADRYTHISAEIALMNGICIHCYGEKNKLPDNQRFGVMQKMSRDYADIAHRYAWLEKKIVQHLPTGKETEQFLACLKGMAKECWGMAQRFSHDAEKLKPEFFDPKKVSQDAEAWCEQYFKELNTEHDAFAVMSELKKMAFEAITASAQIQAQKEKKALPQVQQVSAADTLDSSEKKSTKQLNDAIRQVKNLKDKAFGSLDEATGQRAGGTIEKHASTAHWEQTVAQDLAQETETGYMVESHYSKAAKSTDEQAAIKEHLAARTAAAVERMPDDHELRTSWSADANRLSEEAVQLRAEADRLRALGESEHIRIDRISEPTEERFEYLLEKGELHHMEGPAYRGPFVQFYQRIQYTPTDKNGKDKIDCWTGLPEIKYFEKYSVYVKDDNGNPVLWGVAHIHFPDKEAPTPSLRGQHFKLPGQEAKGNKSTVNTGEQVTRNPIMSPSSTLIALRTFSP